MNMFKKPAPDSTPSPQVDEVQGGIDNILRQRLMQGRAATMLSAGGAAPTAQRQVLGN